MAIMIRFRPKARIGPRYKLPVNACGPLADHAAAIHAILSAFAFSSSTTTEPTSPMAAPSATSVIWPTGWPGAATTSTS